MSHLLPKKRGKKTNPKTNKSFSSHSVVQFQVGGSVRHCVTAACEWQNQDDLIKPALQTQAGGEGEMDRLF